MPLYLIKESDLTSLPVAVLQEAGCLIVEWKSVAMSIQICLRKNIDFLYAETQSIHHTYNVLLNDIACVYKEVHLPCVEKNHLYESNISVYEQQRPTINQNSGLS